MRLTAGERLDAIIAQMSVLAEASASTIGSESGHQHAESQPPPGAWSGEPAMVDDTRQLLHRLADVLEVELIRFRGGDSENPDHRLLRAPRGRREDVNERITKVWGGKSARFVAYVEDVPEKAVQELRKHGRELWDKDAA